MAVPASRRKHNVFVGNLTYNTTEDQLRDIFGTVGPVTSVRIVVDKDTGRPKGYAFVEYDDPALALSAIRNLDGHDFNARKLRVSYSNNNSELKDYARQQGQDVPEYFQQGGAPKSVEAVVAGMKLSQAYDVLETMKRIVDEDNGLRAKAVLEAYPQLVPAFAEIQRRLGMVTSSSDPRRAALSRMEAPLSTAAASTTSAQYQMHQALNMSEEDLLRLPSDTRAQLVALRQQL